MIWLAPTFALNVKDPEYAEPVGAGVEACRSWSANRRSRRARDAGEEWLYGFLSGADFALAKSDEQKMLWPSDTPQDYVTSIDEYCASHPRDAVSNAARILVRKLKKDGGL
jgi:hypothetical protein